MKQLFATLTRTATLLQVLAVVAGGIGTVAAWGFARETRLNRLEWNDSLQDQRDAQMAAMIKEQQAVIQANNLTMVRTNALLERLLQEKDGKR